MSYSPPPNPVRDKSYQFALDVLAFGDYLIEKKEYILSKQLMRSGASIGANVEEATQAQSKADFISKMSISLKESYETHYWLRLSRDSKKATPEHVQPLLSQCEEIIRLLTAIIKRAKENG